MINENLQNARNYIALENELHIQSRSCRAVVTLGDVIKAFNALSTEDRTYLSQAHAEAKYARLGKTFTL